MNLRVSERNQTCILGIGNSLRRDDGIGNYICEKLRDRRLDNTEIMSRIELDPALAEQLHSFRKLIIIDAAANNPNFDVRVFKPVLTNPEPNTISSHGIEAYALAQLMDKLYEAHPEIYLVAVKGYDFDLGMEPTESAIANAERAIELIVNMLQRPAAA